MMRPNPKLVVIALSSLLLLALSGCGGTDVETGGLNQQSEDNGDNTQNNDNQPNDDNNELADPEFYDEASELADTHCERLLECCTDDEHHFEDQEECRSASAGNLFGLTDQEVEDAEEAGSIAIDTDAIQTCREAIGDLSCSEFDATPEQRERLEGCPDIIDARQQAGDSCDRDWECATGACGPDDVCIELAGEGESCAQDRCALDYYCNSDDECAPKRENGEECNDPDHCISGHCIEDDPDSDFVTDATCQETAPRCEG